MNNARLDKIKHISCFCVAFREAKKALVVDVTNAEIM